MEPFDVPYGLRSRTAGMLEIFLHSTINRRKKNDGRICTENSRTCTVSRRKKKTKPTANTTHTTTLPVRRMSSPIHDDERAVVFFPLLGQQLRNKEGRLSAANYIELSLVEATTNNNEIIRN